jgi:O-antigen ligase
MMPQNIFSNINEPFDPRQKVILGLICAAVAVPPFLWGGRDAGAQAVIFVSLLPLLFFTVKTKGRLDFGRIKPVFFSLAVFLVIAGISIFYSPEKYDALKTFSIFFSGALLCFLTFNFIDSAKKMNFFGYLVLALGVILSLSGLYDFFLSQSFGFLRLTSTFYSHIPFGEFITYPFLAALGLMFLGQPSGKQKWLLVGANSLFAVTLYFDHCRGAWVSLVIVCAALAVIFKKVIFKKAAIIPLATIAAVSALAIFCIFQIKSYQASQAAVVQSAPGSSANGGVAQAVNYSDAENAQDNAASARFVFWQRAWDIFKDRPLTGGGLESFADYHRQYVKPPYYYAADPHNFYLKVLAETGIFGFLAFIFFVAGLAYCSIVALIKIRKGFAEQYENKNAKIFLVAMAGGIFAGLMDNGINFGWSFPADVVIFFVLAGIVLKVFSSYAINNGNGNNIARKESPMVDILRKISIIAIFVLAAALLCFGLFAFEADLAYKQGISDLEQGETNNGLDSLRQAAGFNPIDPQYNYQLASIYLSLSGKAEDGRSELLASARDAIGQAGRWSDSSENYLLRGKIELALGDNDLAVQDYGRAIEKYPWGFKAYVELAKIDFDRQDYSQVHTLTDKIFSGYKKEYILSPYFVVPDKTAVLAQAAALYRINGGAYSKEKKPKEAQAEYSKADSYSK